MERSVPFKIQKGVGVSMSRQMTNGLREAIASGYYKPGVVLPTILEWSKLLGVSIRVPEAAVAALVREGLITAQRRTGCVVNARRQDVWVGRVLVIVPDGDHVYYQNVLVGRLRARISELGYMFSQVTVLRKANGRYDFRLLAHELKARPNFALLIENRPDIERFLSKTDVPFGVFGPMPCRLKGCVASFLRSNDAAVSELVSHCEARGVRRVLQASKETGRAFDAVPALRAAGIGADEFLTPVELTQGRAEGTARGALDAFRARFLSEGRAWLPELLVFTDDYVASGALTALQEAGLRIPADVKVVSLSNTGLGPVYPMSLTRLENDPFAHGDQLSESVCAFLQGRRIRQRMAFGTRYVNGESFP